MYYWHNFFSFVSPKIFFDKFDTNFKQKYRGKRCRSPFKKNLLINLSVTVVYPPDSFRFHILSSVSKRILAIFGVFIRRYEDKSLNLRW